MAAFHHVFMCGHVRPVDGLFADLLQDPDVPDDCFANVVCPDCTEVETIHVLTVDHLDPLGEAPATGPR